ncbi:MAG: helix-turn-helix domain-containing protein [Chloroflexota bacterium]|nr:helix-turn-helix domain-containing protein [Chloroflexota bacterium]
MTSVIDLWRAVDPDARQVSGSQAALAQPVRGVLRTRAAPPHLPSNADGEILVLDSPIVVGRSLDELLVTLHAADLRPVAIVVAGVASPLRLEPAADALPILASGRAIGHLTDLLAAYLGDEQAHLHQLSGDLRLAAAEAALADPDIAAPTGLVAARMRRGVAVVADGEMRALHSRRAGQALAARFAGAHARLLAGGARLESSRRLRDGLWLLERRIRPGAGVWFFDDLPFARVDEVAADALAVTLRALLRRSPPPRPASRRLPAAPAALPGDRIAATLLAVARSNGRIAPAARALGVHRNTVLYRLRAALRDQGIDPRRPDDALRILAEAERRPG